MTHTHIGYRPHTGYVHCGSRLHGHRIPKAGKRHALTGGPERFVSLCGEVVWLVAKDEYGDPVTPNVRAIGDDLARPPECKRCLKALATA